VLCFNRIVTHTAPPRRALHASRLANIIMKHMNNNIQGQESTRETNNNNADDDSTDHAEEQNRHPSITSLQEIYDGRQLSVAMLYDNITSGEDRGDNNHNSWPLIWNRTPPSFLSNADERRRRLLDMIQNALDLVDGVDQQGDEEQQHHSTHHPQHHSNSPPPATRTREDRSISIPTTPAEQPGVVESRVAGTTSSRSRRTIMTAPRISRRRVAASGVGVVIITSTRRTEDEEVPGDEEDDGHNTRSSSSRPQQHDAGQ
jgi:hypothetical protein